MRVLKSIGIAVAAVFAGSAQAGDWVVAGLSEETFVGYDRSSVTRVGPRVTAWWYLSRYDPATGAKPEHDYYVMRSVFECGDFRQTDLYVAAYNASGEQIADETVANPRAEFFGPDTLISSVSEKVCDASLSEGLTGMTSAKMDVMVERIMKPYRDALIADAETDDATDAEVEALSEAADAAGPASDGVARVPPCSNGAAECDPWDRAWPEDGGGVAVGTVVTRDGRVIADPAKPQDRP